MLVQVSATHTTHTRITYAYINCCLSPSPSLSLSPLQSLAVFPLLTPAEAGLSDSPERLGSAALTKFCAYWYYPAGIYNTENAVSPLLGGGLRVGGPGTPPFGARGRSSVWYGTRLGDLKENWFVLFSN